MVDCQLFLYYWYSVGNWTAWSAFIQPYWYHIVTSKIWCTGTLMVQDSHIWRDSFEIHQRLDCACILIMFDVRWHRRIPVNYANGCYVFRTNMFCTTYKHDIWSYVYVFSSPVQNVPHTCHTWKASHRCCLQVRQQIHETRKVDDLLSIDMFFESGRTWECFATVTTARASIWKTVY